MNRQFQVLVEKGTRYLQYPPLEGRKALACMKRLSKRGFRVAAQTSANGVTEWLSLAEMQEAIL